MCENPKIADIRDGDEFIGFYALQRCELKDSGGSFRLVIELADMSGHVPGVVWEEARELRGTIDRGMVVKIKGRMGSYGDKPQVTVTKIRPAELGEYDPAALIAATPCDVNAMTDEIKAIVDSIAEPHLSELAHLIFDNRQFLDEYTRTPGGMKWHHPYLGGLLEHSLGVTRICAFMAEMHPELNRDLLVLAGLLHDVGKIREFSVRTTIEYSDEGRLEGHIVIGERFVRNMCERIDGFPANLKMMLSHLMLSHQGHREFGTPVEPMIPEGFVLYYADEMDSKLNALARITRETIGEGRNWSEFVRILNRYIYVDTESAGNMEDTAGNSD